MALYVEDMLQKIAGNKILACFKGSFGVFIAGMETFRHP